MYCDNCGASIDDEALFCSKCGNQLLPQKTSKSSPPPPRPSPRYRRTTDGDFLCFGDQQEGNPYTGGLIMIFIAIFLAIIFFVPNFPIEVLVVLGFFLIGLIAIINGVRKSK